ncbi:MAG: hypothetical protein ACKO40_07400 [Planctomycetaceae bacterium]
MVALDTLSDVLLVEIAAAFPDRRVLGAWLYGSHARGEVPLILRCFGDFEALVRELVAAS